MAISGVLMVLLVLLVRPQEFVPALQTVRLLYAVTALAAIGITLEIALGKQRPPSGPQVPWLFALLGWCVLVTVRRLGVAGVVVAWDAVGLGVVVMLGIIASATTLARWRAIVGALLAVGAIVACVCIHQSRQPAQCVAIDASGLGGDRSGEGTPDGRPCDNEYVCEQQGRPLTSYICERAGLFETFTEGRRVRWRGTLGDPNELALLLGALLPLALAFAGDARRGVSGRGRRPWLAASAVVTLGASLWCIVLTGSRAGQLVVVTVLGATFVRRHGLRGALLGALLALPVVVLGGRAGEEADSSSLERVELLYDGIDIIRAHPLLGVGVGQFTDQSPGQMTAHNSYVLAAAELGLPGCLLWTMLLYTSIKIPWSLATRAPPSLDPRLRSMAVALVVAFAGLLVGMFFLSFSYKAVLFLYFGLSGALFAVAREGCPGLQVRISAVEVLRVAMVDAALLASVFAYSHWALGRGS